MDKKFTSIPGFGDKLRLPLLGKIRLGMKVKKPKTPKCQHRDGKDECFYCTYPKETPHFIVPDEVKKIYGETPTQLDIWIPSPDPSVTIPCSMRRYGSTAGLKCLGNGTIALDIGTKQERPCPCEHFTGIGAKGEKVRIDCNEIGFLFVILYKVNLAGVYQIRTSSVNSVTDIISGIKYAEGMLRKPITPGVPLILKREALETHHDQKKQTHYTMKIQLPQINLDQANRLIASGRTLFSSDVMLPAPIDENPIIEKSNIDEQGITDEEDAKPVQEDADPKVEQTIDGILTECNDICEKNNIPYAKFQEFLVKYAKSINVKDENVMSKEQWIGFRDRLNTYAEKIKGKTKK